MIRENLTRNSIVSRSLMLVSLVIDLEHLWVIDNLGNAILDDNDNVLTTDAMERELIKNSLIEKKLIKDSEVKKFLVNNSEIRKVLVRNSKITKVEVLNE